MKTKTFSRCLSADLTLALSGCAVLTGVSGDPMEFNRQVYLWVPVGTPSESASKIMKRHGFEVSKHAGLHGEYFLDCHKESGLLFGGKTWDAQFLVINEKVKTPFFIRVMPWYVSD